MTNSLTGTTVMLCIGAFVGLLARRLLMTRSTKQLWASHTSAGGEWQQVLQEDSQETKKLLCCLEPAQEHSESKQIKLALQHSAAKLNDILNSAITAIACYRLYSDDRLEYEYFSPSHVVVFGYTSEELLADTSLWRSRLHSEDRSKAFGVISPSFSEGSLTTEYRFYHKDGTLRWILDYLTFRQDEGKNSWVVTAVAIDNTARKSAEEALRQQAEREQLLRAITQRIRQSLNLDEILAAAVTEVRQTLQARRALVFKLTSVAAGFVIKESEVPVYSGCKTQEELCTTSKVTKDTWADYPVEFIQEVDIESKLVAPITQHAENGSTQIWGFLVVYSCCDSHHWQPVDAEFLQQIANQLAIAIQQANLYQRLQLELAERKQAEAALRQSKALKNRILQAIPDLIIWMTADGTCLDFIDGSSVFNILTKSEAIGKNLYDLLPLELAQARMEAIQQALQTGEVKVYEQQLIIHGEVSHEEVRVVGVGGDRLLVIIRNITARKRVEAALRDSEERFRSAFNGAPIGMALIGLDYCWLKLNPMLCAMLGYSESELLSMSASALIYAEDISTLQNCVDKALANENCTAQAELRYQCREGGIVWGMLNLSLVRDAQNQPLYYVAQIQDITEQHAIDRMKNEFISIVSHELRTPLTAIQGFLGLLNTGIYSNKPEKAKHMIELALTNTKRLVRLVNDILDLERLSSGRVQLAMAVCDAQELMQRAVEGVQAIADAATVALCIIPTNAQVWAAPDSIIQTLTNLLSNAIKFSPNSVVTLSAEPQLASVLFQVKDQGRGIPLDKLEIIFERFQQVDVSDARQKGGTGLGLAICQSIVQQHNGSIWAESTLGEGSSFCFTLPMPLGK